MYTHVKRILDFLLALLALIALSPLLLALAAVIRATSPGPVFFRQKRVGRGKTHFMIYKFRTMRTDTPKDQPTHLLQNPDAYITPVGRVLRRTSLDELPQLFNVLKGDMSLVGPRPLPTYESEKCNEEQLQRLLVKPGITCYWQVCGRNDVSFDEWIEMDLRYIREQSIRTDVRILLQTVKAVLSGRGAY